MGMRSNVEGTKKEAQFDFLDYARVCMALNCTVHAWFGGLAKSVSVVSDTMRHLRFFRKGARNPMTTRERETNRFEFRLRESKSIDAAKSASSKTTRFVLLQDQAATKSGAIVWTKGSKRW